MVQPHRSASSIVRPLKPPPAFTDASPVSTHALRSAFWATEADAEFRADLLAATPSLRAFAFSLVGDRSRADDLVQDTLLRAWQRRDRFEPGTCLQAWAFTLLRNLFYSECRKRKREVEDVDGLFAATLSTPPEQLGRIEVAALRCALMQLSDEQREAVLLNGAEGLTYEEAAQVCGVAIGTIKSRVNRARRHLAQLLAVEEADNLGPDRITQAALQTTF